MHKYLTSLTISLHFNKITAPSNGNYSPTLTIYNIIKRINPKSLFKFYPSARPISLVNFTLQNKPSLPNFENKKFSNTHFLFTQEHPQHFLLTHFTLTLKNFSKYVYPFSPIYYFHSDPNDEDPNYVIEHELYPTLSLTSFYHFTNPLSLPSYNTPL